MRQRNDTQYRDFTPQTPILIQTDYLGAIKQIPYLLQALRKELPAQPVFVDINDFHPDCNGRRILQEDIKKLNPALLENLVFNNPYGNCLYINFRTRPRNNQDITLRDDTTLDLYIDPLKFESRPKLNEAEITKLKDKYGLHGKEVIIGGSLYEPEIMPFCTAIEYARTARNNVHGLIVPRHDPVETRVILNTHGKKFSAANIPDAPFTVVEEAGILQDLYSVCDTAVIGNTLWMTDKSCGQNPLEPAFYGKYSIAGKNHDLNEDAFQGLKKSGLLVEVGTQDELNAAIVNRPTDMEARQKRAMKFITANQGAAERYAKAIKCVLSNKTLKVHKRSYATPSYSWL